MSRKKFMIEFCIENIHMLWREFNHAKSVDMNLRLIYTSKNILSVSQWSRDFGFKVEYNGRDMILFNTEDSNINEISKFKDMLESIKFAHEG